MIHSFKQATSEDVEDLASIDYELFPENNFNERTILHQIESGVGYVLQVDGLLAGYMICSSPKNPPLDILRLGVREKYRKVGIASVLLNNILRLGKDIMLTVRKTNVPAISLYLKYGFLITGTMPQHDSWIMRRSTGSS